MPVFRSRPRLGVLSLAAAAAAVVIPSAAVSAQYLGGGTKDAGQVQIADLEAMKDKFVSLAEAFPEDTYSWRPMEGVRSVKDVFVLIAAEGGQFPTMWGHDAPAWVAKGGFGKELERLGVLSKAELITELGRAFDHIIGFSKGLSAADRANSASFFGLTTDLGAALTLAQTDMHEHLGQAIAYARMNKIVPPWSRRN